MNITLTVGGVSVPIHPLDASLYQLSGPADDCLGSFQAITAEDPSKLPADFILSAAFLRNVYSVYSCDSVLIDPPPGPAGACKPQVGLLPLTNKTQAADEFHRVRVLKQSLGGGSDAYGDGEASKGGLSDGAKIAIGTIVGVLGGVIILFLLALFLRRKIMSRRPEHDADGDSSSPTGEKDGQAGSAGVAGMSAAQLAKARQLRQLQGIFDDDIDVHDTHLLNHSAAAQDRSLSGAQVQPEWGAGFSPSSPAIGTESTSASGFRYYEADRIKRDYLRRHPSLDRLENEAQSGTLGDDESRSPQPSQCQSRHSESASDSSLVRLVPRTRTSATTTSIAPTASGLNRFSRRTEYESGTGTGTGTELDPIVSRPSTRLFGTPVMNVDLDMDMDGREREEEEPFGDSFGTPLRRLDCS